jgi:hypothetical protein
VLLLEVGHNICRSSTAEAGLLQCTHGLLRHSFGQAGVRGMRADLQTGNNFCRLAQLQSSHHPSPAQNLA